MIDKRALQEVREAASDVHHGWRQEKARGDADALAHVQIRAEEAGASPEDIIKIRAGYAKIAKALIDEQSPQRRREPWRPFRRRSEPPQLPGRPARKQLPPGDTEIEGSS
jgi:hypothetical protein